MAEKTATQPAVSEAASRMLRNFAKIMASMMEARPEGFASRNRGRGDGGRGDGAAAPRAWATDIRLRAERLATRPSRPAPCQTPFPDAATIFYVWTIVATLLGRVLI